MKNKSSIALNGLQIGAPEGLGFDLIPLKMTGIRAKLLPICLLCKALRQFGFAQRGWLFWYHYCIENIFD